MNQNHNRSHQQVETKSNEKEYDNQNSQEYVSLEHSQADCEELESEQLEGSDDIEEIEGNNDEYNSDDYDT